MTVHIRLKNSQSGHVEADPRLSASISYRDIEELSFSSDRTWSERSSNSSRSVSFAEPAHTRVMYEKDGDSVGKDQDELTHHGCQRLTGAVSTMSPSQRLVHLEYVRAARLEKIKRLKSASRASLCPVLRLSESAPQTSPRPPALDTHSSTALPPRTCLTSNTRKRLSPQQMEALRESVRESLRKATLGALKCGFTCDDDSYDGEGASATKVRIRWAHSRKESNSKMK